MAGEPGAPARRAGRVLDAAGEPVEGAMVAVASGTAATPEIGIRTGPHGRFIVALPPGTFRLEARAAAAVGSVDVEGGPGEEIVIRLRPRDERVG